MYLLQAAGLECPGYGNTQVSSHQQLAFGTYGGFPHMHRDRVPRIARFRSLETQLWDNSDAPYQNPAPRLQLESLSASQTPPLRFSLMGERELNVRTHLAAGQFVAARHTLKNSVKLSSLCSNASRNRRIPHTPQIAHIYFFPFKSDDFCNPSIHSTRFMPHSNGRITPLQALQKLVICCPAWSQTTP
jgi:hypothetical protein